MILDGHVHLGGVGGSSRDMLRRMAEAGVAGGVIISQPPQCFQRLGGRAPEESLEHLLDWTASSDRLFPFFWIDPLAPDAIDQVRIAVDRGVAGFKVICSRHEPGHDAAMRVYRAIAAAAKPILFHSGILWDGSDSSRFNRPANFECLLEVPGLRFALAHASWPWHDECIAVFGKFADALRLREDLRVEMFIDVTPGTPPVYRPEVLKKLFACGYDVAGNVIFGTDQRGETYRPDTVREWIDRDTSIQDDLGLDEQTREGIFAGNLLRFVGAAGGARQAE